jgi:hypothetical protein
LLTNAGGRPVAVEVYPGNTADPTTVPDQVEKLLARLGLTRVVLAGDRGMLTTTQTDTPRQYPGPGWISALPEFSTDQGGQSFTSGSLPTVGLVDRTRTRRSAVSLGATRRYLQIQAPNSRLENVY